MSGLDIKGWIVAFVMVLVGLFLVQSCAVYSGAVVGYYVREPAVEYLITGTYSGNVYTPRLDKSYRGYEHIVELDGDGPGGSRWTTVVVDKECFDTVSRGDTIQYRFSDVKR